MPDEGDVPESVTETDHRRYPADGADNIERKKAGVMHFADAGNESRKGSDDRNEFGVDDCLSTVPLIEGMRAVQVFAPEYLRVFVEQAIPNARAEEKADSIARDGRNRQKQDDHSDL